MPQYALSKLVNQESWWHKIQSKSEGLRIREAVVIPNLNLRPEAKGLRTG